MISFHQIVDLSSREVDGGSCTSHFLVAFVIDLTSFDTKFTENLVLDFGREIAEKVGVDVEVFGT
jgi:hypothetical protein